MGSSGRRLRYPSSRRGRDLPDFSPFSPLFRCMHYAGRTGSKFIDGEIELMGCLSSELLVLGSSYFRCFVTFLKLCFWSFSHFEFRKEFKCLLCICFEMLFYISTFIFFVIFFFITNSVQKCCRYLNSLFEIKVRICTRISLYF